MVFRVTVWHVWQLDTWLTANAPGGFGDKMGKKRRAGTLVHAKSRHNFLAK